MIRKYIPGSGRLPPCTPKDMISLALQRWDEERGGRDLFDEDDCEVRRVDGEGGPYLVVEHRPTGRTSEESGDDGRWSIEGWWFADKSTGAK